MTGIAAHAQETVLKTPALEVFLDELIKERTLRAVRTYGGALPPELASLPAGDGHMIASLRNRPSAQGIRPSGYPYKFVFQKPEGNEQHEERLADQTEASF